MTTPSNSPEHLSSSKAVREITAWLAGPQTPETHPSYPSNMTECEPPEDTTSVDLTGSQAAAQRTPGKIGGIILSHKR